MQSPDYELRFQARQNGKLLILYFNDVGVKTCAINLACITYYIYAYHDFWKKLRCS